ncbi:hypothetical protein BDV18DRAFT_156552 [Aspergillus unguis]
MTSPTYRLDPLGQPGMVKDEEERQMVSYHDMTAQSSNDLQCPQPTQFALPYSHFAVLFLDHRGDLQAETSSSLVGYEKAIFTDDVQDRFLKVVSDGGMQSMQSGVPGMPASSWYHPSQPRSAGLIPCEWQSLQYKRARRLPRGDSAYRTSWEPPSPGPSVKRAALRVSQTKLLQTYYQKAFEEFQQLNCRVIAKAFVKLAEPRKQVKYPYNGKRNVPGSMNSGSLPRDPEMTKPPWWPEGVIHREPDHLQKSARIHLLVHILCHMRHSPHEVTAARLKDACQDVRRQLQGRGPQVLDEIFYVREMEELYQDGKLSGDTIVHVTHGRMEDEVRSEMYAESTRDQQLSMASTAHADQHPSRRTYRDIPIISEDTPQHSMNLRNNKRPAGSDFYQPMSPVSTSPISRKSSMERGLTASYSSEIDPAILSPNEPTRNTPSSHAMQSTGPTSLPELFAHQFAPQTSVQASHPAYWGPLPTPAVPQPFTFTPY